MSGNLFAANTPERFWRLLVDPAPRPAEWAAAVAESLDVLPQPARAGNPQLDEVLSRTLGEGQFGSGHWNLSRAGRLYYTVKPLLPRRVTRALRRLLRARAESSFLLGWPVEDRYAQFLWAVVHSLLQQRGADEFQHIDFWPGGQRFALVLTHDVETAIGQAHVLQVADLEAQYGFHSSFNFVPERYSVDTELIATLRARGFEVGIHGLKHDGRLFSSYREFMRRAERINRYMKGFGAHGFRSPLTHRNPDWMQALDMEYDLSFFDSDPYEPMPGGTMSLWPFQVGHFLELPYTLPQDYTLTAVLKETTPRLWLNKLRVIEAFHGMALVNTHPDYLRESGTWRLYSEFLRALSARNGYWHALPLEVTRWWRARQSAESINDLPSAVPGRINRDGIRDRRSRSDLGQLSAR